MLFAVYAIAAFLAALMALAVLKPALREVTISLAILPLAVFLSFCLPQDSRFLQATVFYVAIFVLSLVYRHKFANKTSAKDGTVLTWRENLANLPTMIVAGQILGGIGFALTRHDFAFEGISGEMLVAGAVILALAEEVFLRGLIQQQATKILHPVAAAALAVVVGTLMGVGQATILVTLVVLANNIVLSSIYRRQQNLFLTFAANLTAKLSYLALLFALVY